MSHFAGRSQMITPDFQAHPLFLWGHAQTLAAHLIPIKRNDHEWTALQIPLRDGECLSARMYRFSRGPRRQTAPLLLFFHGLGGSADSNYMQESVRAGQRLQADTILVNHRGVAEGAELAKSIYHSGRASDLSDCVQFIRKIFPKRKVIAIGYSLSGNLILNMMAGRGGPGIADAALSVNPSMNLPRVAESLSRGMNRIYSAYFCLLLHRIFAERVRRGLELPNPVPNSWRLRDLDEKVTAPLAGFSSAEEYYRECSSFPHLSKIDRPVVVLHAQDDPFIPALDFETAKWSATTDVALLPGGGHLGYLALEGGDFKRWLVDGIASSLGHVLRRVHPGGSWL